MEQATKVALWGRQEGNTFELETTLSFQTINSLKLYYSFSLSRICQARCNLTDAPFFPLAWSSVESSYNNINKYGLLLRYRKDFR